jgi:DNA-binding transcriptional MerR regulator
MENNLIKLSKASIKLGVSAKEIKEWENEFSTFLEVSRDGSNSRVYTPENLDILTKIRNMKGIGANKETIHKLLSLQHAQVTKNKEITNPNNEHLQQIGDLTEEIFNSIANLTETLEEKENKQIASFERRVEKIESNIVSQLSQVLQALQTDILDERNNQALINLVQLSTIEKKVDMLTNTSVKEREVIKESVINGGQEIKDEINMLTELSMSERELYRNELLKVGESVEQKIAERDAKFIEMVQFRRKRESGRFHNKWGIGFLKSITGFAK